MDSIKKSATRGNGFYDRVAATNVLHEHNLSRCTRVSVEGYDPSLPKTVISGALKKHFSPCGRIYRIAITRDEITRDRANGNAVERCGFIYFLEQGWETKALALSGSDMGGWNVLVKPLPKLVCEFSPDLVSSLREADYRFTSSTDLFVSGYDTLLPEDDVKSALIKHFSSCGEITHLNIRKVDYRNNVLSSRCVISIFGQGAEEKALALSGSDVGGWNVVVEAMPIPDEFPSPDPFGRVFGYTPPDCRKTAK